MSYVNTHHDTDPLAWSGLNLQYLLGKVDWLSSQQEETEDKMRHLHNWDQAPALETAFLGPQLWDKKVNMKIFGHETGSSSAQSESPSPPHFQPQVGGVSSEGARWECGCHRSPTTTTGHLLSTSTTSRTTANNTTTTTTTVNNTTTTTATTDNNTTPIRGTRPLTDGQTTKQNLQRTTSTSECQTRILH